MAFVAILLILVLGPLAGALTSDDNEPMIAKVGRPALEIAGAFALLAVVVLLLMKAAHRTRFAAVPMGMIGLVLLVPTALAAASTLTGADSLGWLAICFATIGVPGACLLVASVDIWRKADLPGP